MRQKATLIAKLIGLFFVMPLWSFFAELLTMPSDVAVAVGFLGYGCLLVFVIACFVQFIEWSIKHF